MTAQIALYPDSLLAQLLMATTYPDDFAAATAWSKAHPDAKGDDAVKMVENEPWDPSVASMVAFPEVLITLGEKPDWVQKHGRRVPGAARRRDELGAAAAPEGAAGRQSQVERAGQGVDAGARARRPAADDGRAAVGAAAAGDRDRAGAAVGGLRAVVQPGGRVWRVAVSGLSAVSTTRRRPATGSRGTVATGIAWGVGIGVTNALWGGCRWGRGHDVNINVNRYNNINVNRRIDGNGRTSNWNHNPEHRGNTPYRGGDATRQNLDNKYQAGNREQYRGKDASRDASRERANQAMQNRGVDAAADPARDRAQSVQTCADTSQRRADRAQRRRRAEPGAERRSQRRAADRRAQGADSRAAREPGAERRSRRARQRAQSASRDNALRGANSTQAGAQMDRGRASQAAAQRRRRWRRQRGGASAVGGGGARAGGGGGGGRGGGRWRAAVVAAADGVVEMERMNMKNIKHILNIAAVAASLAVAPVAFAQNGVSDARSRGGRTGRRHRAARRRRDQGGDRPDYRKYIPAASVDPDDVTNFLAAWARAHKIVPAGDDKAYLGAGTHGWTLPIPIVKTAAGWRFDTKGGARGNARAPHRPQRTRGDPGRARLHRRAAGISRARLERRRRPGVRDARGLSIAGQARRPVLGVACRASRRVRWARSSRTRRPGQPYHGYVYRILTAQGKNAPGGARSYVKNGRMTDGYALVAWPAKYDDTGVMTFIVNQDGVVYQKNLGANTDAVASAMKAYDPDASWQKVAPAK